MKLLKFPKRRKNRPTQILESALDKAPDMKCAIVLAGFKNGRWEVFSGKSQLKDIAMAKVLWEKHVREWLDAPDA